MKLFDQIAKEAAENTRAAAEIATRKRYEDELKFQSDLLTVAFDKAAAYLNVVKIGGYGAFFALWHLLGDGLSKPQRLWSALFIGTSVLFFVLFEIFKSFVLHQQIMRLYGFATAQPDELEARKRAFQEARNNTTRVVVSVWRVSFYVSLLLGMAGALTLLGSVGWNLMK